MGPWIRLLVLVALLLLLSSKRLRRFLLVQLASKETLERVGRRALARTNDRVTLVLRPKVPWRNQPAIEQWTTALVTRGFAIVGDYLVPEFSGLMLRLVLNQPQRVYAVLYDHPRAGQWIELVTRYEDGTSASFSTLRPTGLDSIPGHLSVKLPGATVDQLHDRCLAERPGGRMIEFRPETLASTFEQGYAEGMARRKAQGASAEEVRRIGMKRL